MKLRLPPSHEAMEAAYARGYLCLCRQCLKTQPERRTYLIRARAEYMELQRHMDDRFLRESAWTDEPEGYGVFTETADMADAPDYACGFPCEPGGRQQSVMAMLASGN